ncbi:MAG: hypothetical protein KA538_08725 [Azonexus sp.]|jgi:hypothetical protein|nr:hypothetical protein [Azonexus sp.]
MTELVLLLTLLGAALAAALLYRSRKQEQPIRPVKPELACAHEVGRQVAEAVAERLERGDTLAYSHRDYCGVGLRYVDGEYICGEVADGELPSSQQLRTWRQDERSREWKAFTSRREFIEWLSQQTDDSLNGNDLSDTWLIGNQRLTLVRLLAFAKGQPVPYA